MRRLRGLLGKRDLPSGHGMLLRPAWSIHTAFMRFPIDVVFLDADQVVIKIVPRLPPFKTASCRGAREVVELRAGECDRRGLSLGDRVAWAARATADEVPTKVPTDLAGERHGAVVLASRDQRYLKLVRFLLDGKGIDVVASVPPSGAADAAGGEAADVVVIDTADTTVGEGLRLANVTRARRPEATVVLVGEQAADRTDVGHADLREVGRDGRCRRGRRARPRPKGRIGSERGRREKVRRRESIGAMTALRATRR